MSNKVLDKIGCLFSLRRWRKVYYLLAQGKFKDVSDYANSVLFHTDADRVIKRWSRTKYLPFNCWDIPAVIRRWNYLVCEDEEVEFQDYTADKFFQGRTGLHGLSLACGEGAKDFKWAKTGIFERIDGCDLSEQRIRSASENAKKCGLDGICRFTVGDVYDIYKPGGYYDVVIADMSLHHFTPLEDVIRKIDSLLKPDGYLIVNEFVGPTRFQWTDRQLEAANGLLALLPHKYRVQAESGAVKKRLTRPSVRDMLCTDPSEAVESSNIMPLLNKIFDVVEVKEYGGTLLHLLFGGIAQHFLSDDAKTRRFLRLCLEAEDFLLACGDIQSDYVFAVCRKQKIKEADTYA